MHRSPLRNLNPRARVWGLVSSCASSSYFTWCQRPCRPLLCLFRHQKSPLFHFFVCGGSLDLDFEIFLATSFGSLETCSEGGFFTLLCPRQTLKPRVSSPTVVSLLIYEIQHPLWLLKMFLKVMLVPPRSCSCRHRKSAILLHILCLFAAFLWAFNVFQRAIRHSNFIWDTCDALASHQTCVFRFCRAFRFCYLSIPTTTNISVAS